MNWIRAPRTWLIASLSLGGASIGLACFTRDLLPAALTSAAGLAGAMAVSRLRIDDAQRAGARETEAKLLAAAQAFSLTGVWEVNLATGFGVWSESMYRLCGLEPKTSPLSQEDLLKAIHPNDRRKLMQITESAAREFKPFQVAHLVLLPDGSSRSCVTRGQVLAGPDGTPSRMVGATQDVTDQARMEESLRDAEARFLAFMDHSPFSAWMRDSAGQFIYCNERFAEHMGMQAHEIVGSSQPASWLSRDYVERSKRDDQRVLGLGRPSENIEHVPLRDGSIRHWLTLKFPIRSQSGEMFVGGVSLDLTGRYEADEKLRASEKRLRSVMQSASEGIAATDEEGKIVSWNPAAEKIFGYKEAEILGQPLTALLVDQDRPEYLAAMAAAGPQGEVRSLVLRACRKGGSADAEFALEISRSSWRSGSHTLATVILRDVTERRRNEERLRASEAQMRMTLDAALDAVPQIVWTAHADGKLSFFNRKWFEYAGVSFPLSSEQGWLDWVHPDDLQATAQVWKNAIRYGQACEMEYRLRWGADASYRWHIGRALPVKDSEGIVVQWFGTSTDIHDHKQAQEEQSSLRAREAAALETSRLKSEFLAHMSHEIRTPINGVIGMADLLLDTSLDRDQKSFADAIRSSADSLLGIINDILDFSKIEAGKVELESIDFDLVQVLSEFEKTIGYQARAKGLELKFDLAAQVPRGLRGDPGRLRQVLGNLVSNAIKFTARGGVRVRIALESGAGLRARFEVVDSGIGIESSTLTRMFQPFLQADSSTTRRFGGTGLGLSICKRLVEQMGGEIGVESQPQRGSTFWFTLPFAQSAAVRDSGVLTRVALPFSARSDTRVLVAEDNPVNQTIILKRLAKMGIRADAVANGHEALAALRQVRYDLVLMDCQMPGMDGYEATAKIRALTDTQVNAIPIVAVTANAIKGDREKCLALGMNDYISKPVQPDDLVSVLRLWLKTADRASEREEKLDDQRKIGPSNIQDSVIASDMIEELRSLDDGQGAVLKQLVGMFADTAPDRVEVILRAHAAADLKTLNSEAHSLKSSAANLGANAMALLCHELECVKDSGSLAKASGSAAKLRGACDQALRELQALVVKTGHSPET